MSIQFTTDQVLALAPDSGSASAGKKLAQVRHWKTLGQSSEALWGECQGSALYQVKIDLASTTIQCSCPSRKFPCKHGLGLLLVAVANASSVETGEPPEWVATWLAKRAATKQKRESTEPKDLEAAAAAQAKRAEKRSLKVAQGLDRLDLWLSDLVRNGLAAVESQPDSFWANEAAPLDDAQAATLAARVRSLAAIPNASPDWPTRLLAQLGRLTLLTQAYRHSEKLDAALQEDIRQQIGWSLRQEELAARGETVSDDWLVLGQWVEDGDRGLTQRTWLYGSQTGRPGLILQFSVAGTPFPEVYLLGTRQPAELTFWPSAYPIRARIDKRQGEISPIASRLPGHATLTEFLGGVSLALARQPWQERFFCLVHDVIPIYIDNSQNWLARDQDGLGLPLIKGQHWRLLALSGGHPIDLISEWDGQSLRPLAAIVENNYHPL